MSEEDNKAPYNPNPGKLQDTSDDPVNLEFEEEVEQPSPPPEQNNQTAETELPQRAAATNEYTGTESAQSQEPPISPPPPPNPPTTPPSGGSADGSGKTPLQTNYIQYDADTGRVFQIWFLNALFRILTLGIYTFWGKTRMRRFLASGFVLDGDRFEYTGTGKELFFGFLKAIPIYLIAIGPFIVVQIMTADAGEDSLQSLWILPAYIPLIYFFPFAYFAARRYRLSRTTWRGIRFSLHGSAIKYANYAMGRYFLNTISLGILTPYSEGYLHKHVVDRMEFGNIKAKFHSAAINYTKLIWLKVASGSLFIIYPAIAIGIAFLFGEQSEGIAFEPTIEDMSQDNSPVLDNDRPDLLFDGNPTENPNAKTEEEINKERAKEVLEGAQWYGWALGISFLVMLPIWFMLKFKYAAELLRGKINGMVIGDIRFKCSATAWDLFKLAFGNGLIHMFSFGWGACFIIQRRMRFLKNNVVIGGDLNSAAIKQAAEQKAGIGEGIDDIFDFDTGFIGGGII